MEVKDNIITFKSLPEHYVSERDGTKPNTVRQLSNDEIDRWDLAAMSAENNRRALWSGGNVINSICIVNSKTGAIFTRTLSDVTVVVLSPFTSAWVFSWIPVDNQGRELYTLRQLNE